jgi:hypothetical protein
VLNSASIATARLRAALDAIARALQSPDLAGLLAAELGLASALAGLGRLRGVSPLDRGAVRNELARARAALARCRALGSVIEDVAQATLVAQGRGSNYDRAGARPMPALPRGGSLKARM